MKLLGEKRVFADHYQFYIADSGSDPFNDMPDWTDDFVEQGYMENESVVHVATSAHLNDHWVQVYLSDSAPRIEMYERVIQTLKVLPSGCLFVLGPLDSSFDTLKVTIDPGIYSVYVLSKNMGVDQYSTGELSQDDEEMSDEELKGRTDLEHYHIVLVKQQNMS